LPHIGKLEKDASAIRWPTSRDVICEASGILALDTAGAVFLRRGVLARDRNRPRPVSLLGLRPAFAKLLDLVNQHAADMDAAGRPGRRGWLEMLGQSVWIRAQGALRATAFIGQGTAVVFGAATAPRSIRWRSLLKSLESDGFNALPIIGLLSFLMGIVIAYQGAEQLRTVGGNIFIVDLVGISLLREIAPLVTAILVAGRSGSAYTAQIGTMRVTEELDALQTLGLSPFKVLVLPKVLALTIAVPLLAVYADVVGVFGGMLIASSQLNVSAQQFLSRFDQAIALRHFVIGIVKAPVFAAIIGLVGCYQGFQIRGGVDDVGRHTTISVVQSIFLVIVFDALFSIVMSWWNL
jgi:phospholipid/cholesterol/gamma-HCH transport system permease protein